MRRAASAPVAAAADAPFDAKAAFRVQSQPAAMDFSDIGTPAAATEPSPVARDSAVSAGHGVGSSVGHYQPGKLFFKVGVVQEPHLSWSPVRMVA